ncbi:GPI ethanolamine phosphate transferas-like protein 2 [Boeremia exigua]|uniref:GPI ethanolamine phosphate transferase-like protein 2 n=1 Tax=Boeremia exigua TaxID=749465 RepID=UPI001E8E449F|nr:GPI ethanolamine phosphate transferase-like protein 2 [Boeremia exigua]KAH6622408.1 GPI ethanolamine phosphate transferas-like protein 2 [Boeremia exigua]
MAPRTVLLALANLLIPAAILIFATGFFPYKPFMPGLAEYEEISLHGKSGEHGQPPEAPFDKLIFMVVDALRSDFVYGEESGMSFVQSLIRDGTALPFTAHATSPTITMPRVKAITTGSIPSFLDVILNFAESDTTSTLATQDTWLAQIKAKRFGDKQGKLVMYGDDTWLKLFPDFFERADGTSSFFVSDFTEVDNNVTRHVPNELLNDDWNAMIMHYLGLDHIGHKAGPKSPNMVPKQKEMDEIVHTIYAAIENEDHLANALFVLCGDHGMNEGGNHGGSSPGETSPALVFMSPKLTKITQNRPKIQSPTQPKSEGEFDYYRTVEQSDIAPTLAGLLGFPVPKNNLGVFLSEFMAFWDGDSDRNQLLYRNARQIKRIVEATYSSQTFADEVPSVESSKTECDHSDSGEKLACRWSNIVNSMAYDDDDSKQSHVNKFMHDAQEIMSSAASNYDVPRLFLGTALASLIPVLTIFTLPSLQPLSSAGLYYFLTLALYAVLMFASSYVEEEHNIWYWITSGWFFSLFLHSMRNKKKSAAFFHPALMVLVVHRIIRRWNQTGQKFAGADDIVTSGIFHGSGSIMLWLLIGTTYLDVTNRISAHIARSVVTLSNPLYRRQVDPQPLDHHRMTGAMIALPLCGVAFLFKLAFTAKDAPELTYSITPALMAWVGAMDLVGLARTVFGGIALVFAWILYAEYQRSARRAERNIKGQGDLATAFFDLFTLFLLTQTKAQNIPLYLLFRFQIFFLSRLALTPTQTTLTSLLLSQTSFFALGLNNSISSVDLANAYNGISGYNVLAVGLLVFLSNWAGPVYWSLAGVLLLGGHESVLDGAKVQPAAKKERSWVQHEHEYLHALAKPKISSDGDGDGKARAGLWLQHVKLLTLFTGIMLASVMASCTALRTHLFIWTVFSPKYLFAMAWGVAWHLGVTVGLGGLVWWFGRW